MAYPKRVYTDGVEEVSYVDMNRIETGIETNDLAIAKINADNIARDKEISTKETITGAQEKANVTLKSAKEYADGKVKLNGSTTNVNFIGNEVIGNALVRNEIITGAREISGLTYKDDFTIFIKLNANNISDFSSEGHFYMLGKLGTSPTSAYLNNGASRVVFKGLIKDVKRLYTNTESIIIIKKDNVFTFNTCDTVTTFELTEQLTNNVFIGGYGSYNFKNNSYFTMSVFDKALTQQEIQHYFSVLNNSPSISSIETTDSTGKTSLLLATKSDLVETRTGHTDEERYTALLGKFGKKFTSTSENITVDNGIEKQRLLSGKIEGQTVKNYARMSSSYGDLQNFTLQGLWGNQYNFEDVGLEANKSYYVTINIKEFNSSANLDLYIRVRGIKDVKLGQITKTGIYTFAFNTGTQDATPPKLSHLRCSLGTSTDSLLVSWFVLTDKDVQISNCFSGLCSTQATLSNNGIKYPFYATEEDKASGKVITLGGVGEARNTLEILEDGSAICSYKLENTLIDSSSVLVSSFTERTNTVRVLLTVENVLSKKIGDILSISDKLKDYPSDYLWSNDVSGLCTLHNPARSNLVLSIMKTELASIDVVGVKKWIDDLGGFNVCYVSSNPTTAHIPKELVQAIATEQTNIFSVDSPVKPSSMELTVPVDKITDLEKRLEALEAINL